MISEVQKLLDEMRQMQLAGMDILDGVSYCA